MTHPDPSSDTPQTCDLCGGNAFSVIASHDRNGSALSTVLCDGCGLVMHMPIPDEAAIESYYAETYRHDYHGERQPSPRRIMRAWLNGQRIVQQIQPYIPSGSSVFEVGAGIGCNVKSFAEEGFSASGIEPNKDFNHYTRHVLHADVDNRNLYALKTDKTHDVVILIHVIEHFVSPKRALSSIRELIRDEGYLYVECPNVGGPFATFSRLFHFAHIYNFTPNTLIAMAQCCGYEVVQRFTDDHHPDIEILFRKTCIPEQVSANAEEAARVHQAIHRYNIFSYHLRPAYWVRRLRKVIRYLREYAQAKGFVAHLEDRFKQP